MALVIHTIPAFEDNYLWLFHEEGHRAAYVVDPGDAQPIEDALKRLDLDLAGILVTHHHPDHTGGINRLLSMTKVPVYGPDSASIPQVSHTLTEGERITLANTQFTVLEIPGHTLDHIAYVAKPVGQDPLVFCGDTLFTAGCGRIFEGTAAQMYQSLEKLNQLPEDTLIYCAHEYTLNNLAFASALEPHNQAIQSKVTEDIQKRQKNIPTVPSTIKVERETNPFLRSLIPAVIQAASEHCGRILSEPVEVLGAVRLWKDNF